MRKYFLSTISLSSCLLAACGPKQVVNSDLLNGEALLAHRANEIVRIIEQHRIPTNFVVVMDDSGKTITIKVVAVDESGLDGELSDIPQVLALEAGQEGAIEVVRGSRRKGDVLPSAVAKGVFSWLLGMDERMVAERSILPSKRLVRFSNNEGKWGALVNDIPTGPGGFQIVTLNAEGIILSESRGE